MPREGAGPGFCRRFAVQKLKIEEQRTLRSFAPGALAAERSGFGGGALRRSLFESPDMIRAVRIFQGILNNAGNTPASRRFSMSCTTPKTHTK
jgi:hypothetical protein